MPGSQLVAESIIYIFSFLYDIKNILLKSTHARTTCIFTALLESIISDDDFLIAVK